MSEGARLRAAKRARKLRVLAERGSTPGERRSAMLAAEQLEREWELTPEILEQAEAASGFDDLAREVVWTGMHNEETFVRDVLWRRYLAVGVGVVAPKVQVFLSNQDTGRPGLDKLARLYRIHFVGAKEDVLVHRSHFDWCVTTVVRETRKAVRELGLHREFQSLLRPSRRAQRRGWIREASLAIGICDSLIALTNAAVKDAKPDDFKDLGGLGVRVVDSDTALEPLAPKSDAIALIQRTVFDREFADAMRRGLDDATNYARWEKPPPLDTRMQAIGRNIGTYAFDPGPDLQMPLREFLTGSGFRSLAGVIEEHLGARTLGEFVRLRRDDVEDILAYRDWVELEQWLEGAGIVLLEPYRWEDEDDG